MNFNRISLSRKMVFDTGNKANGLSAPTLTSLLLPQHFKKKFTAIKELEKTGVQSFDFFSLNCYNPHHERRRKEQSLKTFSKNLKMTIREYMK